MFRAIVMVKYPTTIFDYYHKGFLVFSAIAASYQCAQLTSSRFSDGTPPNNYDSFGQVIATAS